MNTLESIATRAGFVHLQDRGFAEPNAIARFERIDVEPADDDLLAELPGAGFESFGLQHRYCFGGHEIDLPRGIFRALAIARDPAACDKLRRFNRRARVAIFRPDIIFRVRRVTDAHDFAAFAHNVRPYQPGGLYLQLDIPSNL